jgi:hypothetical protein
MAPLEAELSFHKALPEQNGQHPGGHYRIGGRGDVQEGDGEGAATGAKELQNLAGMSHSFQSAL